MRGRRIGRRKRRRGRVLNREKKGKEKETRKKKVKYGGGGKKKKEGNNKKMTGGIPAALVKIHPNVASRDPRSNTGSKIAAEDIGTNGNRTGAFPSG